ncbi:PREDICTED: uncharacterized protein LOC106821107 [Priapulus caudatus]|uniref:Uncharacterized protein LOC106821107 n=1 Tax=Priapulus caudatus TaxID=37621 RepID=A0ABM1F9Z4_PRICU|nr:PREDICTED: uncharacterized protein LOC106821107 [Priapulus caudatus]XP_014681261.1 PREDICTED: uncharacterized protein LOC106821107 [Priapulus caudatus]XP_014681262.1 PREDICTED: uncharacterized protein LOC106821107 [Priapulus caudatus]XP_014681263.1 PREDICTED: uncharacterized protein LOC106821107 [Priapulus caudatus]XP_014681264.1 PREDICTED: uncharacterized protein LOC106821107 [Priapulus caudatus]XP_014681265.1 PREDICTED: uncharacterized protein LOC106821107 [Priapulus caudatus]
MEGDILYKSQLDENGCNKADEMYLNVGTPDNDALRRSVKMMATATKHRMKIEESEGNLFQYGPVRGDYRFRENLAKFLTDHYQDTVIREDLFVTAGATMGLAYLTTRLFPTGSTIFVENPTYYIAISVLRDELGMNIVPVFSKNGAIDVEAFEHQLESAGLESYVPTLARPFSSMLYLVSTFNNPTGISCPPGNHNHGCVGVSMSHMWRC